MMADQAPRLTSLSPGAGCACKLPLAKLEALFASMGPVGPASGDLLIGAAEGDDAAVLRLDDERALVLTTDFFTPIVDDPQDWGRIAAANALSDVYAMGGRPLFAVNLAAWPGDGPGHRHAGPGAARRRPGRGRGRAASSRAGTPSTIRCRSTAWPSSAWPIRTG